MSADDPLSPLRSTRPVDPGFADRLEASLRVQHAGRPDRRPTRGWARQLLLLGPAIVLVLVASAVLVLRDDSPSAALELHEAHNVTVTLSDGSRLVDPDGLELADGAVLAVGPGGRAVIGDVELGPGTVVTVRHGELVTADPATTTSAPTRDATPDPTVVRRPSDGDDPSSGGEPDPGSAPTDRAPVDDSPPGRPPVTTEPSDRAAVDEGDGSPEPGPAPTVPPDTRREPSTGDLEPDHPARIVDLTLTVRLVDSGVLVGWRASGSDLDGLRVVLLRSRGADAPDPDWPAAGPVTIAAETTGAIPGEHLDAGPDPGVRISYRAVALDGHEVVARSAVQTLVVDR